MHIYCLQHSFFLKLLEYGGIKEIGLIYFFFLFASLSLCFSLKDDLDVSMKIVINNLNGG